ncbi:hypothetical protein TorRG33x02_298780 [Trema orientale]|uniref:Uncharacterized protein n=1 Tax=Trema orientale TaxID=63057 RepID=A0A2P5C3I8_TREOI|nr:hypothetical protein TorRG33x02_298780 [Trema orientale]
MGLCLPKRRRICSLQRELWNVSGQCLVLLTKEVWKYQGWNTQFGNTKDGIQPIDTYALHVFLE